MFGSNLERRTRLRLARAATGLLLFGAIAGGGSAILVNASGIQSSAVKIDSAVAKELVPDTFVDVETGDEVETYLLVGSDTREGADPNSPDYGGIGPQADNEVRRSDTIMILRHEKSTGRTALLSLPRDLYVKVDGKQARINTAYSKGTDVLVSTIKQDLGIQINHYVEIDFNGFKALVDAVGGVEACFWFPTRDQNTGLNAPRGGCFKLNGTQALQYARSRHFEEFRDGAWHEDPRSDLGRIARQQQFIIEAVSDADAALQANPYLFDDLFKVASMAVRLDPDLELLSVAHRFRGLKPGAMLAYTLPTTPTKVGDDEVLLLDQAKAGPMLDFFRGTGAAPPPGETEYAAMTAENGTAGG